MNINPSIVLVEDNQDDERLTLRALSKALPHVPISVARDGQEALDRLLDEHQSLPSLVLLDLKLPKLTGIEVLTRLRTDARTKHLTIVVLTSSDEPADVKACYEGYANSYLRKPVAFDEFMTLVQQLGIYWMERNVGLQH